MLSENNTQNKQEGTQTNCKLVIFLKDTTTTLLTYGTSQSPPWASSHFVRHPTTIITTFTSQPSGKNSTFASTRTTGSSGTDCGWKPLDVTGPLWTARLYEVTATTSGKWCLTTAHPLHSVNAMVW